MFFFNCCRGTDREPHAPIACIPQASPQERKTTDVATTSLELSNMVPTSIQSNVMNPVKQQLTLESTGQKVAIAVTPSLQTSQPTPSSALSSQKRRTDLEYAASIALLFRESKVNAVRKTSSVPDLSTLQTRNHALSIQKKRGSLNSSALTFDECMKSEIDRKHFIDYANSIYSGEGFEFIKEVQKFKDDCRSVLENQKVRQQRIYILNEKFNVLGTNQDAEKPLNISSINMQEMRTQIEEKTIDETFFDAGILELLKTYKLETYPRFLSTLTHT